MNKRTMSRINRFLIPPLLLACGLTAAAASDPALTPISLAACLELALRNNLDLQNERRNPEIIREDRAIALAGYDPSLQASARHYYEETKGGTSNTDSLDAVSKTESDSMSAAVAGTGPLGMKYEVGGALSEARSPYGDSARGSLGITLTQPLLKNFLFDDVTYNTRIAGNRLDGANIQIETTLQSLVTKVAAAYYALCYTRENIRVQTEGIALARQLRDDNRRRVEIGAMTPLDQNQAESQIAAREADLSNAKLAYATAQNLLKSLIYSDYMAAQPILLDPSDPLSDEPPVLDPAASWSRALQARPELIQKRIELEGQGITVRYLENRVLPSLDLVGSGGFAATDADSLQNAFSDIFDTEEPYWSAGIQLSIPLNNGSARAKFRQGKLQAEQRLIALKRQEQAVLIEVDEAIQRVKTRYDRMLSTRQERAYAEQSLEAEQKKMKSGNSTSFVVLQLQRDLIAARAGEIGALVDYQVARIELRRAEGDILRHLNLPEK